MDTISYKFNIKIYQDPQFYSSQFQIMLSCDELVLFFQQILTQRVIYYQ